MFKKVSLFLFTAIVLVGCVKDKPISQIHNFTEHTWQRFDFLNFEIPIEKTTSSYDISVILRYNEDFPVQALLVNLVMTMPSGEERIRDYKFSIRDNDESFLGEKKPGYYERIIKIRDGMKFSEPGVLTFEIENLMPKYFTPGIVEFGILLEPAK